MHESSRHQRQASSRSRAPLDTDDVRAASPSLGRINRERLLRTLRLGAPLSRVALAERTGISKPAVTRGIRDLLERGLVIETGHGQAGSGGGKRPIMLELDTRAAGGLGAMIKVGRIVVALANFAGEFECRRERRFPRDAEPAEVIHVLTSMLREVCSVNPDGRPLLGLGVGVPGLVDGSGRVIVMPQLPGWRGLPLASLLREEFGMPVAVENESRAHALAEKWFGAGREVDDFVSLGTGVGVGAGIVVSGRLLRGQHSLAGEVGHTSVYADGDRCYCNSQDCWEVFAATTQLLEDTRTASIAHSDAPLYRMAELTVISVAEAVAADDPVAIRELETHADALTRGICNLILTLDPDRIIIHGESALFGQRLLALLRARVRRRFSLWLDYDPPITFSALGDDGGLSGAVSLALGSAWGLGEDHRVLAGSASA